MSRNLFRSEGLSPAFERWLAEDPLHDTLRALPRPQGRGIVTCANDAFAPMAEAMIFSARHFGSQLPVEIHHAGNELSESWSRHLTSLGNVRIVDVAGVLNLRARSLRGWQIKAFAAAASRFEEILIVDADVLWFGPPDRIFELEGFRRSGSFFFRDRNFGVIRGSGPHPSRAWLMEVLSDRPDFATKIASIQHLEHYAEAGVVAWDRKRLGRRALATTLFLNGPWRRRFYRHFHGDKESWWISCLLEGREPAFTTLGPGALRARVLKTGEIAHFEQMLHYDPEDSMERLWCQGSHLHRKSRRRRLTTHDACTGPDIIWRGAQGFKETSLISLPDEEMARLRRSAERLQESKANHCSPPRFGLRRWWK